MASPEAVQSASWVTALIVAVSTPIVGGIGALVGRLLTNRNKTSGNILVSWAALTKTLQDREKDFQTRESFLQSRIDALSISVNKCEADRILDQRRYMLIELDLKRCHASTERWEAYTQELEASLRLYLPKDVKFPKFAIDDILSPTLEVEMDPGPIFDKED